MKAGVDSKEISLVVWNTVKVLICSLTDFPHNPRLLSKKDFERLVQSIKEDGYHQRILVDFDNTIIGGHSRKKALLAAGFKKDDEIEVLRANRPLTDTEFKRLNIRDNLPFGDFDFEMLSNHFDGPELLEWGMPESWFEIEDEEPVKGINTDSKGELCDKCPYKANEKEPVR